MLLPFQGFEDRVRKAHQRLASPLEGCPGSSQLPPMGAQSPACSTAFSDQSASKHCVPIPTAAGHLDHEYPLDCKHCWSCTVHVQHTCCLQTQLQLLVGCGYCSTAELFTCMGCHQHHTVTKRAGVCHFKVATACTGATTSTGSSNQACSTSCQHVPHTAPMRPHHSGM